MIATILAATLFAGASTSFAAPTENSATPPVNLALPHTHARVLPLTIHRSEHRRGGGMFLGPVFVPEHRADALIRSIPEPVRRTLAAPVGPWAMTAQPIGNSVATGVGMYARF